MSVFPITSDVMRRLGSKSIADDLRDQLCQAEISIHRNLTCLTDARSSLYGQPFWMVTAAEALAKAEIVAANRRRRLEALGEPPRRHPQTDALRRAGALPPVNINAQAEETFAALTKGTA